MLKPTPGGSLTWAKGEYKTKYGILQSEWHIADGMFHYSCSIPEMVTATLQLPSGDMYVLASGKHRYKAEYK